MKRIKDRLSILGDGAIDFAYAFLDWTATPIMLFCLKYYKSFPIVKRVPDALVLVRLLLFWVPSYIYYLSIVRIDRSLLVWSILLGIIIALTDAWDGRTARAMGVEEGEFGKIFDPLADKLFTGSIVVLLLYVALQFKLPLHNKAMLISMPLIYILLEVALVLKSTSIKRKLGNKMPHSNNFGKIKFTLASLSLAIAAVGNFLFSMGAIDSSVLTLGYVIPFGITAFFAVRSIIGYIRYIL